MTEGTGAEVDFEVDADELENVEREETVLGDPCVVVDNLNIVYRVFGGRAVATSGQKRTLMQRALHRGREHVGAVNQIHAVRDVSFVAHRGESIGIVGINGSGKSTLLRAVAGLMPPRSGSVYIAGEPSLLGVNAVLMGELTGERNIMIGGLALGLTQKQVQERFDDIVEFSGIGKSVYLPMKAYSSGMGARLRFAISTSATPDILMIDEALATGDAAFREKSLERVANVRRQAGTVFLVSHSIGTVQAICSRILWMHQGQLVMDGPADEVGEKYKEFVRAHRQSR